MRKYIQERGGALRIIGTVLFFLLVLGIITGSVFYIKSADDRKVIGQKLSETFLMLSKTENSTALMKGYFIENALCCAVIFAGAYFRAGAALSSFAVLRKGFVTGFTSAAAAGEYGIRSLAFMSATVLDIVISSAVLIALSAVSVSYSISAEKKSKKFLIFFAIFAISIFCVLSFCRGFATTTFMKMIYPKIT